MIMGQAGRSLKPWLPAGWRSFKMRYRYYETYYQITVRLTDTDDDSAECAQFAQIKIDGAMKSLQNLNLINDQREHTIEIRL